MSYSSMLDALPESLRQPNKLALIASVAFHGVAFAVLPYLPSSSGPINSQRVVDLVELSPAEQSRLPQSASPTAPAAVPPGLPPLGIGSLPPNLPNYVPGQPGSSFSTALPNLGRQPDLSSSIITVPIPQGRQLPQQSTPRATFEPFPNIKDFEVPKSATDVPPFDPNKLPLPQVEADNAPVPPGQSPAPFPGNPGPVATAPNPGNQPSPGTTPSPNNPPQAPTGPVERWLAQTRQVSPDTEIALQEKEVTLPYPQEACDSRMAGRSKVAALVDPQGELVSLDGAVNGLKLIDSTGYPTLNAVALNPKNYAIAANGQYQRLVFSADFEYSEQACAQAPAEASTSEQPEQPEATPSAGSRSQLLATARQTYDSNLSLRPATIPYTYPSTACEDQLSGLASVISVVKPDGKLAEAPRLTKSSGEKILDEAAVETVANHSFTGTGQHQAYITSFGFEYTEKACAGKSSPAPQSSQAPQSEPASPTEKTPPTASPQSATPTPASPQATEETPSSPAPAAEETPSAPESQPEPTSESSEPTETPTPLPELPGEASPPSP